MPIQSSAALHRDTTAILDDFRRIVGALRESSRAAERSLGVSSAQLFVLNAVAEVPALSINALAERTRTHQSTVSVVVKRLIEAGFVKRTRSPADGRRVELAVTSAGRALLRRAPSALQDRLIQAVEALPTIERKRLAGTLRGLAEAMHSGVPGMFFEDEPRRRTRRSNHVQR